MKFIHVINNKKIIQIYSIIINLATIGFQLMIIKEKDENDRFKSIFVASFLIYNKMYIKDLLEKGYVPNDEMSKNALQMKGFHFYIGQQKLKLCALSVMRLGLSAEIHTGKIGMLHSYVTVVLIH